MDSVFEIDRLENLVVKVKENIKLCVVTENLPPNWVKQSCWPHCLLCSEQSDYKTTLYLTYGSYIPKSHIHFIYLPSLLFSLVTDSVIK